MRNALSYLVRRSGAGYFLRKRHKEEIPVLCFHRVTDEIDPVWPAIRVNAFREIVAYCSKYYQVILPHQWEETSSKPKLIITFDDGFGDFMEYALPILVKAKLNAIHHVVIDSVLNNRPNWTFRLNRIIAHHLITRENLSLKRFNINFDETVTRKNAPHFAVRLMLLLKDFSIELINEMLQEMENANGRNSDFPKMMDEKDMRQCNDAGVQIGSHSYTHLLLKGSLDQSVLHRELVASKKFLEEKMQHPITSFAFPAGIYDEGLKDYAAKAGYEFLFAAGDQYFKIEENLQQPLLFPRIVPPTSGADEAILKLEGFHSQIKNWIRPA